MVVFLAVLNHPHKAYFVSPLITDLHQKCHLLKTTSRPTNIHETQIRDVYKQRKTTNAQMLSNEVLQVAQNINVTHKVADNL